MTISGYCGRRGNRVSNRMLSPGTKIVTDWDAYHRDLKNGKSYEYVTKKMARGGYNVLAYTIGM